MGLTKAAAAEQAVLRARAAGELSADQAFERLHALHAPAVRAFLRLRVPSADAEDLVQEAWTIFYTRWRVWDHRPEMEAADAKPVLSFLYRTCHYLVKGHRRRVRVGAAPPEAGDDHRGANDLLREAEAGRCLDLARRVLSATELDVLLAKLADLPAREIARALGVTESVVDHRFRTALERLRACLRPGRGKEGR